MHSATFEMRASTKQEKVWNRAYLQLCHLKRASISAPLSIEYRPQPFPTNDCPRTILQGTSSRAKNVQPPPI